MDGYEEGELPNSGNASNNSPQFFRDGLSASERAAEEARIDDWQRELTRLRNYTELKRVRDSLLKTIIEAKQSMISQAEHQEFLDEAIANLQNIAVSSSSDNYEIVNMEIESPPTEPETAPSDEAEMLRAMLLEQMQEKKRARKDVVTTTSINSESAKKKVHQQAEKMNGWLASGLPQPPKPPMISTSLNASKSTSRSHTRSCTPQANNMVCNEQISSESDSDLSNYELDLDEAKEDDKNRRRELLRLVRRQKQNELDYKMVKKSIDRTKEELAELEKKLHSCLDKNTELNERIAAAIERSFESNSKRLNSVYTEREHWKSKVLSKKTKYRAKFLLKKSMLATKKPVNATQVRMASITKGSTIGNNKVVAPTPFSNTSKDVANNTDVEQPLNVHLTKASKPYLEQSESKKLSGRLAKKQSSRHSNESTTNMLLRSAPEPQQAQQHNPTATMGDLPTSNQLSISEPVTKAVDVVPSKRKASLPIVPPSKNFCRSIEEVVSDPLIKLKSYRLFTSFPFEYINHPSVSHKVQSLIPFCPYELHGICVDANCEWQHDRDLRVPEAEIIREMLSFCPSICPAGLTPLEYAKVLLENNRVEDVARSLAHSIPETLRRKCIVDELNALPDPCESPALK